MVGLRHACRSEWPLFLFFVLPCVPGGVPGVYLGVCLGVYLGLCLGVYLGVCSAEGQAFYYY